MTCRQCVVRVFLALVILLPLPAHAQDKLTVEAIYSPSSRSEMGLGSAPDFTWLDDTHYLVKGKEGDRTGRDWLKVDAVSGTSTPILTLAANENGIALNAAATAALLRMDDDLYVRELASGRTTRLTTAPGAEEEPTFSPDGASVAFVRANNLYVVEVESQRERAITSDGAEKVFNGKLDWVYQEEIYGRDRFRAYWWSPDSKKLAFLQLDDRQVPAYTVTDHIPTHPALEVTAYPKAGDPNPGVRLAVAQIEGGDLAWADLSSYGAADILIVDVDWTPDAKHVIYQVQDREQTWLDLVFADATTGKDRRLLRETTNAWVNNLGSPVWLEDGSFLWLSERSGFKHLYRYKADGAHRNTAFNRSFTQYLDVWSNATTPWQARLHRADGSEVRVIDANPSPALAKYRLTRPEFLQVKTRDGGVMDAVMIKPPDFDPSRRYPVFQHAYGGPGSQSVTNRWDGQTFLFHQMLAQNGVIVWICDNRSASGKGVVSQWPIYGRLGELELQDIEDGIAWLKQQPYIDGSRILLSGWSYGGFMTSYALTHSTSFAGGIVGAPVTDWHNYDSVYTERYMKTPQNNADGYAATSPVKAAANLHGRMLLLHGTTDDNVHMQNSVQFIYELQKAGKPFEMMVYPRSRHGITDPKLATHLRQTMFEFVMRTIGHPAGAGSTAGSPEGLPHTASR